MAILLSLLVRTLRGISRGVTDAESRCPLPGGAGLLFILLSDSNALLSRARIVF
jgi:hypothetical protein